MLSQVIKERGRFDELGRSRVFIPRPRPLIRYIKLVLAGDLDHHKPPTQTS